jgi:hypothetical protein
MVEFWLAQVVKAQWEQWGYPAGTGGFSGSFVKS